MKSELEATQAFELHRNILNLKEIVGQSSLLLGENLSELKRRGWYKTLGHETFEEYLASPEVSFSRTTAYNLIKVFELWIEKFGYKTEQLEGVAYDKLLLAGQAIDDDEVDTLQAEVWLNNAKTLSRSDLRVLIDETKANEGQPKFVPLPKVNYHRCEECGKWKVEIQPDFLCECPI